jgi:tRNA-splicing ligase RtcB
MHKYGIDMPDRQLACAPLASAEGQEYLGAMRSAANYAWANRQCIMHWVRESFEKILATSAEQLGMHLVYDVTHNIAKLEDHLINGKKIRVCVHRKGATRSFPPRHTDIPEKYKAIGQPVIIPGDMGTHSYVLVGTEKAMAETFGSTCHGAGRILSRHQAIKQTEAKALEKELAGRGIIVRSKSRTTLQEECPAAYKNIDQVVDIVDQVGLARKVARLRPLGVVKG